MKSLEREANKTDVDVAAAPPLREALAELVRQEQLKNNAMGYGCDDECREHDWSRTAYEAAWDRARALLEETK